MTLVDDMIGVDEFNSPKTWVMLFVEFLGTFVLVFLGCGPRIFMAPPQIGLNESLAFGLALVWLLYTFGPVSGSHVNPAITLSFLVTFKIPILRSICYILLQLAGAALAIFVLDYLSESADNMSGSRLAREHYGVNLLQGQTTKTHAFLMEILGTFVLTYAFHSAYSDKRGFGALGALLVGLTYVPCILILLVFTGASLNPARAFGPAIIANYYENLWIFCLGPILGAILAGLLHEVMVMFGTENSGGGEREEAHES